MQLQLNYRVLNIELILYWKNNIIFIFKKHYNGIPGKFELF